MDVSLQLLLFSWPIFFIVVNYILIFWLNYFKNESVALLHSMYNFLQVR